MILVSGIIKHLHQMQHNDQRLHVLYFFFKHAHPAKRTFMALLVSVISQLVSQDEVALDLVYQRLLSFDQQKVRSMSLLQELANLALTSSPSCFIVINGLDECIAQTPTMKIDEAQGKVIDWIELLTQTTTNQRIRFLISGQRNGRRRISQMD